MQIVILHETVLKNKTKKIPNMEISPEGKNIYLKKVIYEAPSY